VTVLNARVRPLAAAVPFQQLGRVQHLLESCWEGYTQLQYINQFSRKIYLYLCQLFLLLFFYSMAVTTR
jgi:hypothetical protein